VLNPDSVLAQTEGNVIFGLSQTLKEQVSIAGGQVEQNNFYDYPVLRMSEMPEIDIQIMATDNPAKGMGEASLPLVAPCVGNALFKLTGKRFQWGGSIGRDGAPILDARLDIATDMVLDAFADGAAQQHRNSVSDMLSRVLRRHMIARCKLIVRRKALENRRLAQ
jgi:hypothetical protein